ncbi:MAG: heparan-alpha-glucosaminide N-acetyltransferase domain-containing protein, partial [Candidatus Heimdallarchaeota archaeon]
MAVNELIRNVKEPVRKASKRFITFDFARGIAIFLMLFLHIIQNILDINTLMVDINNQPLIALFVLVLAPFFGGLAGFFLLISSASNMISMYRDLENGSRIRSLVFKQIFGGVLLLIFAMICEGITGYGALAGNFFRNLDNLSNVNWEIVNWRWNVFETIHTIAWCLIFNGIIQGLLSLRGNWRNRRNLIISYIIMAVAVVALTQPV